MKVGFRQTQGEHTQRFDKTGATVLLYAHGITQLERIAPRHIQAFVAVDWPCAGHSARVCHERALSTSAAYVRLPNLGMRPERGLTT